MTSLFKWPPGRHIFDIAAYKPKKKRLIYIIYLIRVHIQTSPPLCPIYMMQRGQIFLLTLYIKGELCCADVCSGLVTLQCTSNLAEHLRCLKRHNFTMLCRTYCHSRNMAFCQVMLSTAFTSLN